MHSEFDGFDENDPYYKHRLKALQYLIGVKIYSRTRYNNHAEKRASASWMKK